MNDHTAGMDTGSPLTWMKRSVQRLRAGLTARQQLALIVFVAFLSIQIIVPLVELAGPRPQRFGWQMYSGTRPQPEFAVVRSDGSVEPVSKGDYIGYPRLEMDYSGALTRHLCDADPGVQSVQILWNGERQDQEYECQQ